MTDDGLGDPAMVNVVPITALDRSTIDALWDELHKSLHPEREPAFIDFDFTIEPECE